MINLKKTIIIILLLLLTISKGNGEIKDALLATIGDKPVTKSDIVNEIKIILLLNNESYSDDKRQQLYQLAMKSTVKRKIKEIEIERYKIEEYNKPDLNKELIKLANSINVDLDTLKNICSTNELDFSLIEDQVKIELMWNSLIFSLYKDRLSLNVDEIEEQLKVAQNKKELEEFLISEIIIDLVEDSNFKSKIENLKNEIKEKGFENVAMELSISESAINGGDLGWLNENVISEKFKEVIVKTQIGEISEPIILSNGIIIFKVRDKKKVKNDITIEDIKNQIVNSEKTKILTMYSKSHYDKARRSISVTIFDE